MMQIFISEFVGTFFLLLFGVGVVANVLLAKTKGHSGGWLLINFGWAMAVFIGVSIAGASNAHLNPAVTLAMFLKGQITSDLVLPYISAQLLGAFAGSLLAWLLYRNHYDETKDASTILATFSTGPAIQNPISNLVSEVIGTFALVSIILLWPETQTDLGKLNPLPVALLVLGIGISLGGPTGYAINPARDFGPRLAHALLPIKHKGSSDWSYAWIPILGPILGGLLAVMLDNFIKTSL
jgi:glycerol uptake facilitator protein